MHAEIYTEQHEKSRENMTIYSTAKVYSYVQKTVYSWTLIIFSRRFLLSKLSVVFTNKRSQAKVYTVYFGISSV